MKKEYLILDLDNTIYPVYSIGEDLFRSLFTLIESKPEFEGELALVKRDIMRKPFQHVAAEYRFSEALKTQGIELLRDLEYLGPIKAFGDYALVRKLPQEKFLVTTGFKKLQESKIKGLELRKDFKEIRIVDPMTSQGTKKEVFLELIEKYSLEKSTVLVVGDDPTSELKAARESGLDALLYDKLQLHQHSEFDRIEDYSEITKYLF